MSGFSFGSMDMTKMIGLSNSNYDILVKIVNEVIGNGGPSGVFNTLQELEDRYPNGAKGIYLVTDNGNWYYWNEEWIEGGVYQATGLEDGSVTDIKLEIGIRDKINSIPYIQEEVDSLNNRISNLIISNGDGKKDSEVIDARGDFLTLGDRLNGIDSAFFENEEELSRLDYYKANKSELEERAKQVDLNATINSVNNLQTQLDSMDRGWGGTYATLSALESAFPTGNDKRYVVTADGNWYYWDATEWKDGGVFQGVGITDGSVTGVKTDFLDPSINLFNPNTRSIGMTLGTDGTITANATYDTSDYINVINAQNYAITDCRRVCLYNSSKVFVSVFSAPTNSKEKMVITPTQDGFMRVTFFATDTFSSMVEKGDRFNPFAPYNSYQLGEKLKNILISDENIENVSGSKIIDNTIRHEATNFTVSSKNLYNKYDVIDGYLNEFNVIVPSSTYVISDYIFVELGKTYTINSSRKVNFYDINKINKSSEQYDNVSQSVYTFTSTRNGYIRVSVNKSINIQVEVGSVVTSYVPYGFYMPNLLEDKPSVFNRLYGKRLLNFGDSIAAGDGNSGVGYAEMIAINNDMTVYDYAVGGATVMVLPDSTNNVLKRINDAITASISADYILFDGGTNDALRSTSLFGTISVGYNATLDTSTFCGAFEQICKTLKTTWIGTKIIYVRVHNLSSRDERQITLGNLAIEMCNKWSIPVVDMYNDGGLNTQIDIMRITFLSDNTHPNALGYEKYYVPNIESKMNSI